MANGMFTEASKLQSAYDGRQGAALGHGHVGTEAHKTLPQEVEQLEQALCYLDEQIALLTKQLDPILQPVNNTAEKEADLVQPPASCALGTSVVGLTAVCKRLSATLRHLNNHIAL